MKRVTLVDDLDDLAGDDDVPTPGGRNGAPAPPVDALATPAPEWELGGVGVPLAFHGATFATKDTPALRHARTYLVASGIELGRLLGLTGPTGVGKSWAAAATVNSALVAYRAAGRDLFEHERHPAWYGCAQLVRDVRSFSTAQDTMRRVKRAKLLVIDEVKIPDVAALDVLDEIISLRHAERLATVFTSNLTTDELEAALSDRSIDRLREWGTLHEITGKSLRGGAA